MIMKKMNTLLATTNMGLAQFKAQLKNYADFFRSKRGAFVGERATYEAEPGMVDDPSKRIATIVQTTVDEKFEWLKESSKQVLNDIFTVEKANASNITAPLVVRGKSWGDYTTLELLRLKGIVEDSQFLTMLSNIPVRSDSQQWEENTTEQYKSRSIFQSPLQEGVAKTTVKESYVLPDPNIAKLKEGMSYEPQLGTKNTVVVVGTYTHQRYSGEWSQRQRAELLQKRNDLYKAVIEALKVANDTVVAEESNLGTQVLDYLF